MRVNGTGRRPTPCGSRNTGSITAHRAQSRMIQRGLSRHNKGAATYVTAPASHQYTPPYPTRRAQADVCTIRYATC